MKLDVFVRVTDAELADPLRKAMLEVTVARWNLEPVNGEILHGYPIREGRQFAENSAKSDPYIFTDSDVLIVGKDWVRRGAEAFLPDTAYGAVSTLSLVETENMARPNEMRGALIEPNIYPMHWVGAPMWIRKGLLTDLPEMTLGSECGVIHEYLKGKGYDEGLFNPSLKLRHNHMGHAFSSNPALHWGY